MNKLLVTFAVALTMAGVAQGAPQVKKETVIKDKAERAAYKAALAITDPAAEGAALEAFTKQYPRSMMYVEALEQAWAAYIEMGNQAKAEEIARQVIAVDPDNVDMLTIVCGNDRHNAAQGSADAVKATGEDCGKGLQALAKWQKPGDMIEEEFKLERNKKSEVFNGGSGFAALQRKDYVTAREFYLKALQVDPYDSANNYQLSQTYFSTEPIDPLGIFYAAIAGAEAKGKGDPVGDEIMAFAKSKYVKYHGGEDGWIELLGRIGGSTTPPNPLGIKPAATAP